jgi:hypothetical protein
VFCTNCGSKNEDGVRFCTGCGAAVKAVNTLQQDQTAFSPAIADTSNRQEPPKTAEPQKKKNTKRNVLIAVAGVVLLLIAVLQQPFFKTLKLFDKQTQRVSQPQNTNFVEAYEENELVGVWKGSYGANQGETGLTLNVYKEGDVYKSIFHFYNLPSRTNATEGKYHMQVLYDKSTKIHYLRGYEWIERPGNYVFVDLEGTVAGNIFSGSVKSKGGGGTTFRVVKE